MMKFSSRGFTIVETLVAIAVLVTAVIGTMTAVQTGISSYTHSKEQVVAFYLAQEGFEQIRNIRDENSLRGESWLTGIAGDSSDPCYFGNKCMVSPVETTVATRCNGDCPKLRQDPDDAFYGYNAIWPETNYRREIEITSVNQNEIAVTVTIYWNKGILNRQFKARENILNWQVEDIVP